MNEEIERILNKIKKGAELTKIGEKEIKFPSGNKFVIFDDGDCRMMQDYINGLNQENARLKDNCKQLEKFICYEQDRLLKTISHIYQDSFDKIKLVNSDIFEELKKVENKMKELFKEN